MVVNTVLKTEALTGQQAGLPATAPDWDPAGYAAFGGLRLRPALDLLAQVPGGLPAGDVVDLGCGNGAAQPALARRFPGRRLIGVDASPAMLAETTGYDTLVEGDIAGWTPETAPAVIFSNAALQWLGDHATLLPRLAGLLAPGGVLAVQVPMNQMAPSHVCLRGTASALFPDRFPDQPYVSPVHPARSYFDWLADLGTVSIWETEYLQRLAPVASGHPVRHFTQSTAMRPVLARLSAEEGVALTATYDMALSMAYPLLPDGGAIFPFRRLFLTLQKAA